MVAISAFTAHKPPVTNRELVTSQIIARNVRSSFSRGSLFDLVDALPASHATLARRAEASLVAAAVISRRYDDLEGRSTAADVGQLCLPRPGSL
jgi:hypothetical protein